MANQGSVGRFGAGTPRPVPDTYQAGVRFAPSLTPRVAPQQWDVAVRQKLPTPRTPSGYTLDLKYPDRGQAFNPNVW